MESRILNLILGLFFILSFFWAIISEEQRITAMVIGFILISIIIVSEKNIRIKILEEEQIKLKEKLNIHEQLINIKADLKELQNKIAKNEKSK